MRNKQFLTFVLTFSMVINFVVSSYAEMIEDDLFEEEFAMEELVNDGTVTVSEEDLFEVSEVQDNQSFESDEEVLDDIWEELFDEIVLESDEEDSEENSFEQMSETITEEEFEEELLEEIEEEDSQELLADLASSGMCGETVYWDINDDGVLKISGSGDMTDYTAESGAPWQNEIASILEVEVETGITSIGNYAFSNCVYLTRVSIADTVTVIGENAFSYCTYLSDITLPDSIQTMGANAFCYCESLTEITLPARLTSLENFMFYHCSNLQSVIIPNSITLIGISAFSNCSSLRYMSDVEEEEDNDELIYEISTHSVVVSVSGSGSVLGEGNYVPGYRCMVKATPVSGGTFLGWYIGDELVSNEQEYRFTVLQDVYLTAQFAHVHTFGDWAVIREATCSTAGERMRACTECGETVSEVIAATNDHTYGDWTVTKEPTCISAGTQSHSCSICGHSESSTIAATGQHSYGEWKTTKAATTIQTGTLTRTCDVCQKTETKSIEKLSPTMTLTANSLTIRVKQSTTKFKVSGMGVGDSLAKVTSSNKKILKVTKVKKNGSMKLTAGKKAGTVKLTFKLASGYEKTITVKVQKKVVATTAITGLFKKVTIKKGKKITLKPIFEPITSVQKITYQSSNKKVATVTSKGVVKGVKAGTAKITVKAGKKKFVVTVKVTNS